MSRIVIIDGHPTRGGGPFCHAIADAYALGASEGGHDVRRIVLSEVDFPLLRSRAEWEGEPPLAIAQAQTTIDWAGHLVVIYPLWLGAMPALLKGFLEQTFRPGYSIGSGSLSGGIGGFAEKTARIVVTMGMPGFESRRFLEAHTVRKRERHLFSLLGVRPVRQTVIRMVADIGDARRQEWLRAVRALGRRCQ
jgi:putative NADPH-quinone reductase